LDEELAKQLDHRKQEKRQWLQNPSHKNTDNVENIRRKSSKHVTKKKKNRIISTIKIMRFKRTVET
jgi:hypothetical protein